MSLDETSCFWVLVTWRWRYRAVCSLKRSDAVECLKLKTYASQLLHFSPFIYPNVPY